MKKLTAVFLSLVLIMVLPICTANATVSAEYLDEDIFTNLPETVETAAEIGQILEINAKSAILLEPYTGEILYESNSDAVTAPASITKIMSLLLVMEAIDAGKITLETVVSASEHACSMGGSQIWLEPNEQMSVNDLLKAAVIASANDAIVALGEEISGSEEGFVAQMNERAKQLGMNSTNFVNCSGLDAEGHVTTAHDVAIMSAELIKHSLIKEYSTVWMDSLRNGKSELVNTNKLVRFYKGCTGLKTGTTSTAGYCLAATAERDGMELVAVIMDANSSNDRFNGARKLLDYGFANYSFQKIMPENDKPFTVNVKGGVQKQIELTVKEPLCMLMKKGMSDKIERKTDIPKTVNAPISKGDVVGRIHIMLDGEKIGDIELVCEDDVEKLGFKHTFSWLLKALFCL